jgi:nucleotide-binding universal stress UspA family protein
MESRAIIAAYNATKEAADGIALATMLGGIVGRPVVAVRVIEDRATASSQHLEDQQFIRRVVTETYGALGALVADATIEVVPIVDPLLARGLHQVAESERATFLVVGSSHYGPLGRVLLGGSAELVLEGAPCAVAVAPRDFRTRAALDPRIIGVAYDASPEARDALRLGAELAQLSASTLRIIGIRPRVGEGALLHAPGTELDEAALAAAADEAVQLAPEAGAVETLVVEGDPALSLLGQTEGEVGLIVAGSRGRGSVRRALLGSVSTALVRRASCPVIVVPQRERQHA